MLEGGGVQTSGTLASWCRREKVPGLRGTGWTVWAEELPHQWGTTLVLVQVQRVPDTKRHESTGRLVLDGKEFRPMGHRLAWACKDDSGPMMQ